MKRKMTFAISFNNIKIKISNYFERYFRFIRSGIRSMDLEVLNHKRLSMTCLILQGAFYKRIEHLQINIRTTGTRKALVKKLEAECLLYQHMP